MRKTAVLVGLLFSLSFPVDAFCQLAMEPGALDASGLKGLQGYDLNDPAAQNLIMNPYNLDTGIGTGLTTSEAFEAWQQKYGLTDEAGTGIEWNTSPTSWGDVSTNKIMFDIDQLLKSDNKKYWSLPNVFFEKIGKSDAGKRLEVEGIFFDQDKLNDIFLKSELGSQEQISSTVFLRDQVTEKTPTTFTSSLSSGVVATSLREQDAELIAKISAASIPPEYSTTYLANVGTALTTAAESPGYLRVWNGSKIVDPDYYPEVVFIFGIVDNRPEVCSGVLISEDTVISAAHCLCRGAVSGVIVGTSILTKIHESKIDLERSKSYIDCDKLDTADEVAANINTGDLALYRLTDPVSGISFRQIASEDQIKFTAQVRVVGFGASNSTAVPGLAGKFFADIPISSYDCVEIENQFPGVPYRCAATHEMIAAGLNRDTCAGDSGGPAYVWGMDSASYIAAITSRSVDPTGTCGKGGIYVKLSEGSIRQWLENNGVAATAFAN
ncbi:MAG: trypsin-like serine protease [Hyphomicrobiales bacterium]|nr:trypsin-like serine protease [Hyphomicrobiales bacterium]